MHCVYNVASSWIFTPVSTTLPTEQQMNVHVSTALPTEQQINEHMSTVLPIE